MDTSAKNITDNLRIAPLQFLIDKAIEYHDKTLRGAIFASELSLVSGINEDDLKEFERIYSNTKDEIANVISKLENKVLARKMVDEFGKYPLFNHKVYLRFGVKGIGFWKSIKLLNKVNTTVKYKVHLHEIITTSENLINLYKAPEWIDLANSIK